MKYKYITTQEEQKKELKRIQEEQENKGKNCRKSKPSIVKDYKQ